MEFRFLSRSLNRGTDAHSATDTGIPESLLHNSPIPPAIPATMAVRKSCRGLIGRHHIHVLARTNTVNGPAADRIDRREFDGRAHAPEISLCHWFQTAGILEFSRSRTECVGNNAVAAVPDQPIVEAPKPKERTSRSRGCSCFGRAPRWSRR